MKWLAVLTHGDCGSAMMQQVHAVCDLDVQHIFLNIYKPASLCSVPNVRCPVTMFGNHGTKGQLWKHVLTPERVKEFDHMWLMDSDIFPVHLNLSLIAHRNVNVSQPSVLVSKESKGSDHKHLNHRKFCKVSRTSLVELMTPMFKTSAWIHFYNTILRQLSNAQLCSEWGLDFAWSLMNSDTSVFYDQTIAHKNTLQLRRHNATQCPEVRSTRASAYIHDRWFRNAPRFTRSKYRQPYLHSCLTEMPYANS